jgi:hypothetical protein
MSAEEGEQFQVHSYHSHTHFEGEIVGGSHCLNQTGILAGGCRDLALDHSRGFRIVRFGKCLVDRNRRAWEVIQEGEEGVATSWAMSLRVGLLESNNLSC